MYVHFSVDDTFGSLMQLADAAPRSVFDIPTFGFLKHLHEHHGACITLYAYLEKEGRTLREVPSRFKHEFQSMPWLRLGFHAAAHDDPPASIQTSVDVIARAMEAANTEFARFAGADRIDATLRLHRFAGSRVAVLRDPCVPGRVLLTPDDDREIAYDLGPAERASLRNHLEYVDPDTHLLFLPSLQRLEDVSEPELIMKAWRRRADKVRPRYPIACLFTHEEQLRSAVIRQRVERAMMELRRLGVEPAFPTDLLEHTETRAS